MRVRPTRGAPRRQTGGAVLAITALLSMVLVTATATTSSAAPVSTTLPATCVGANPETSATLGLAKGLVGSDTIPVTLNATAAEIPAAAGLDQVIDARFNWTATMGQTLIDKAAELSLSLSVSKVEAQMLVKGPSDVDAFTTSGPNATLTPVAGTPSVLQIGTIGGDITTTGGGIITYRVGTVTLTTTLAVSGQNFVLDLTCAVDGSNLIAKTTVKDPDAPTFTPEVIPLSTNAGGTATVDLLNGVITPGKTPLLPDSLEIVEQPSAGQATITNGVFSFTAPAEAGTYSTTVQICGAPKAEAGTPGVNEVQTLTLGSNWDGPGLFGAAIFNPRPVAFSLKVGDQETALIWTAERNVLPGIPLPLDATPTPTNWAPDGSAGLVGEYAFWTHFKPAAAAEVQAALEALPNVGVGNVEVTEVKGNEERPNLVTGFLVTYKGALAEQDVPAVALGQWYSVPPQEVLDKISAAVAALAPTLGGDPDAPPGPLDGLTGQQADDYIGTKFVASLTGGPEVTPQEWAGWVKIKLIDPILEAVPEIIAFINGLFPIKLAVATTTQGEAPEPPEPLCAQGIIDVTVTAVAGASVTNGASVAGTSTARGIGFVG